MSKIKERRVWYFTCDRCSAPRRQSHKKKKAKDSVCRKCRRSMPNPNQPQLFNDNDQRLHQVSDLEHSVDRNQ